MPAVQPVATAAAAATVPATAAASTAAATKPAASSGGGIVLVKDADLFKSEPNPSWFGNEANPAPGDDASWTNSNWLKSRFHFSFAEHRSGRSNFGPLRVLNDDLVQPNRGFGTHPHANMEIVTYIVDGFLTHKDTMGTAETLTNGDVQFMTAGRGIRHSEHNLNKQRPLRFIQMWFLPRRQGLPPNYGSMKGDASARRNKWHHILTDVRSDVDDTDVPIKINQDVNMFVTELEAVSYTHLTLPTIYSV